MAYTFKQPAYISPAARVATEHLNRLANHRFYCPRCRAGQACVTRTNLRSLAVYYTRQADRLG